MCANACSHGPLCTEPTACSDENQYTDEQGNEECSVCPHGHASNAANNACDGDECQHPTSLPANSKVDHADASACPGNGTMQSASDGTSASQCTLICSSGYVASNVQPYLCKADSATTAAYDMENDGSITCTGRYPPLSIFLPPRRAATSPPL